MFGRKCSMWKTNAGKDSDVIINRLLGFNKLWWWCINNQKRKNMLLVNSLKYTTFVVVKNKISNIKTYHL